MAFKLFEEKLNISSSILNISHHKIHSKGIKFLLLDVDGTLLPREEINVHINVKKWIKDAKKYFTIHLISNNPSKNRIKYIAEQLDLTYSYKAYKPSRKKLQEYITSSNAKIDEVAIIGDRIFTDILAGNRLGIYTILVKPIKSNGDTNNEYKIEKVERKISKILGAIMKWHYGQ